jgi:hypothetical protein
MSASILFSSIGLLCFYFSPALICVYGFQPICRTRTVPPLTDHPDHTGENGRDLVCHFSAATSVGGDGSYDDNLVAAASKKLDWELSEEKKQKPILDLSLRDVSPDETKADGDGDGDVLEWNRGQRWTVTVEYLSELGVFANEGSSPASEEIVSVCPQLFRLDPSAIQETARWIIDEFGLAYLQAATLRDNNPILLSFRKDDAAYGLEFMSLMMMTDAKPACGLSSALLLEAIRGGIQERAVSAALGAAGNAASQATRSIASDTMESFRKLRDANRNKK